MHHLSYCYMLNQINHRLVLAASISFFCFLFSCQEPLIDDADYSSIDTLHIPDSVLFKSFDMPVDASSLKYVELENNPVSSITRIDQLEIHQDIITVLDGINNKIFLFDISGKFIRSLSIKNRQLYQFDVLDSQLYVYEKTQGKIYQFTLDGNLIKVFNPGMRGGQFVTLHPGIFAYNTLGLKTETKNSDAYQLVISKDNSNKVRLPFREAYAGLKYSFGNQFSRHNHEIDFVTAFNNTFYRVDTSGIKALTKIDFGKYNMTDSIFESRAEYNDYNRTPYVTDLVTYAQVDSFSFHRFAFKGKEGYLLTDRKRKKIINGGIGIYAGAETDFNSPVPICSYKNKLVAIVEPGTTLSKETIMSQKTSKDYIIDNSQDPANPSLMFYRLL